MAQSKFPLEISLRGRCLCRLRRGPHPHRSPPARIFAEQKCLAAAKTAKSAARQSDRCTNCKPVCNCNPERECFLKPQKIISLVRHCMLRTHGISQGSADPCVFTRQRKIATSSRRLDTALLCAAKKRGVELPGWQVSARTSPGPWTTSPAKSPSLPAGSKNKNPLPIRENIRYNITCPHSGQEDETWQNSISNTARWVRARPRPR